MFRWHESKRRSFHLELLERKLVAPIIFTPLALSVIAFGTHAAIGATLGLEFSWPGQSDTFTGDSPNSLLSSSCVNNSNPTVAAGGTAVRLGTNRNYGVWPPNGHADQSFEEAVSDFFAGTIPSHHWVIGQPKLLYDQSGDPSGFGRFILIASAFDNASQPPRAWITIGATAVDYPSDTPVADCTYSLDANINSTNNYWVDAPQIGMTNDALVIAGDMRAFDNNSTFQYSKVWVIPKTNFYNVPHNFCPPSNFSFHYWQRLTNPGGGLASQVIPAKSSARHSAVTYLISAHPGGGSGLSLWALDSDTLTLSPATKLPVRPYSVPPAAPQKGTTQLINTSDTRLVDAVYFPGSGLWTAHTTACPNSPNRSCFKWYQIDPVGGTARQDSSFGYSVDFVYAPAVAANKKGDAVFVFNSSSSNHYVDIDYVGRAASDPLNTLQSPGFVLQSGRDIYTRGAPALHSAADLDPTNDNLFWLYGAYAFGNAGGKNATCANNTVNHDWATWVGAVSFQ